MLALRQVPRCTVIPRDHRGSVLSGELPESRAAGTDTGMDYAMDYSQLSFSLQFSSLLQPLLAQQGEGGSEAVPAMAIGDDPSSSLSSVSWPHWEGGPGACHLPNQAPRPCHPFTCQAARAPQQHHGSACASAAVWWAQTGKQKQLQSSRSTGGQNPATNSHVQCLIKHRCTQTRKLWWSC